VAELPKLSYIASNHKIKCEFTKAMTLESKEPPLDLIKRAKGKLELVLKSDKIGFYLVFEDRLKLMWKALANDTGVAMDHLVHVTIAAGAPIYDGIRCEKISGERSLITLEVEFSADQISSLQYEWFKLNIIKKVRDLGVVESISNAQIFSIFQRILNKTESIIKVHLSLMTIFENVHPAKKIAILSHKSKKEIAIIFRDIRDFKFPQSVQSILQIVEQAVRSISVQGSQYKIFKKDLVVALKNMIEGPENFGVDMPLTLLAAMGDLPQDNHLLSPIIATNYPGCNLLKLRISDDRMMVYVDGFDKNLYNDAGFTVSLEWIKKELKRYPFKVQMNQQALDEFSVAIERKETLDNKIILQGTYSVGGRKPYLRAAFQDANSRNPGTNLEVDNLDLRDMQQRSLVKKGQLIAEIRYKVPPIIGEDIFGRPLPPAPNEELSPNISDGIEEIEPGRYVATKDGIPFISSNTLSLKSVLVYESDVNLSTGNIRFEGPVEIRGSIDSGAYVETMSDLIVHGEIRGGNVYARGNVIIKGGVTTGENGGIFCGGNFSADFIENSQLTVKGDLEVRKALINSRVVCGGGIKATSKESLIAGGIVNVRDNIYTSNLGFERGALSVINSGVDWKVGRALEIRKSRLRKMLDLQHNEKSKFRDLVRQTKNQNNQKQKSRKDDLQERLKSIKQICDRLEHQINILTSEMNYNFSAKIFVKDLLMSNVNITIAGQIIPVQNDFRSICILAKKSKGTQIVPLDEVDKDEGNSFSRRAS